jgi:hypothetical protein
LGASAFDRAISSPPERVASVCFLAAMAAEPSLVLCCCPMSPNYYTNVENGQTLRCNESVISQKTALTIPPAPTR